MMSTYDSPLKATIENPIRGVLGIIQSDGRLLIIQRSKTVRVPLAWCFPGGKIEAGETQPQALVRELREELGVGVTPGDCCMTQHKHGGRLILYCWTATITSGELHADPGEVSDVRWMTPQEIRSHDGILDGTAEILNTLGLY